MATKYQVVDVRSQKVVKEYKSRDKAQDWADMKDQEYGAVRYVVQPVFE